jgi:simple sugar transport system ATP-binding protein
VVFITHKLKEALAIADRIAVLRRGKVVGEVAPHNANESTIAEMMVGRPVQLVVDKKIASPGAAVLSVNDLTVMDPDGRVVVDGISFAVHAGEVVGIAGVVRSGWVNSTFPTPPLAHDTAWAWRTFPKIVSARGW